MLYMYTYVRTYVLTTVVLYESGLRELEAGPGGHRVEEPRPRGEVLGQPLH